MKKEVIFSAALSLLAMAALAASSSQNDFTVQPGPVKVTEGNNVSLWCRLTEYDSQNGIPVHWQSPPKFKTRTSNCQTFGSSSAKRKYVMSCAENNTRWYNMTITDVRWVDRGKYRCIHTRHMDVVVVEVLVPVTEVSLTYVSNNTAEPLFLSKGVNAVLTCKTNCAYPAPNVSWFENDEPIKGSTVVVKSESDCTGEKEGQKRTISTITVAGKYVAKERKESKIICVAGNIGEQTVSTAMDINYGVAYSPPQEGTHLVAVAVALSAAFVTTFIIITVSAILVRKKCEKQIVEKNMSKQRSKPSVFKMNGTKTDSVKTGSESGFHELIELNKSKIANAGQVDTVKTSSSKNSASTLLSSTDGNQGLLHPVRVTVLQEGRGWI